MDAVSFPVIDISGSPPKKKLKQSRLPFFSVNRTSDEPIVNNAGFASVDAKDTNSCNVLREIPSPQEKQKKVNIPVSRTTPEIMEQNDFDYDSNVTNKPLKIKLPRKKSIRRIPVDNQLSRDTTMDLPTDDSIDLQNLTASKLCSGDVLSLSSHNDNKISTDGSKKTEKDNNMDSCIMPLSDLPLDKCDTKEMNYRHRDRLKALINDMIAASRVSMSQAVEVLDFIKAQELKLQIEALIKTQTNLEKILEHLNENQLGDIMDELDSSDGRLLMKNDVEIILNLDRNDSICKKNKTPKAPNSSSSGIKQLTPKQIALHALWDEKREQKDKLKAIERAQKEALRVKRENVKIEKEREKQERIVQREKERLEKEDMKEKERKLKEKEKLEREEQREKDQKAKELEKQLKEEERLKIQELKTEKKQLELEKKEKLAKYFSSFFVKVDNSGGIPPLSGESKTGSDVDVFRIGMLPHDTPRKFHRFCVKKNMYVAPICRRTDNLNVISEGLDKALERSFEDVPEFKLYLKLLKSGSVQPGHWDKTLKGIINEKTKNDEDEVQIIEEDESDSEEDDEENDGGMVVLNSLAANEKVQRAKLLQFHENERPPYWGTFRKKSTLVGGRRPFGQDVNVFDYDYDSDEDWEEEIEGESLSDMDDNVEDEELEVDEEDDGFFVDHGVLDRDEVPIEQEEEEDYDDELEQKRQKLKAQQFEEEYLKRRPLKLRSRVHGCLWIVDKNLEDAGSSYHHLLKILSPYTAVMFGDVTAPIEINSTSSPDDMCTPNLFSVDDIAALSDNNETPKSRIKWLSTFPQEALVDFVRLVHSNTYNKKFIANEFFEFWLKKTASSVAEEEKQQAANRERLSKKKILAKLQEIAVYKKLEEPSKSRMCWVVNDQVLTKLGLTSQELNPNTWEYTLEQPTYCERKRECLDNSASDHQLETPLRGSSTESPLYHDSNKPPLDNMQPRSLITKFVKVLTPQEREQQLCKRKEESVSINQLDSTKKVKKRVELMTLTGEKKSSSFETIDIT